MKQLFELFIYSFLWKIHYISYKLIFVLFIVKARVQAFLKKDIYQIMCYTDWFK